MLSDVRLVSSPSTEMLPWRPLLARLSDCSCVSPDISSGGSPANLLELRSRLMLRLDSAPISSGIAPEKLLLLRSSMVSFCRFRMDLGSGPERLLPLRMSLLR
uniref:Uncharacterized protein n=1 Tax=Arundo donax TaxID=35708 RepID=A0A0A9DC46_ARUDO